VPETGEVEALENAQLLEEDGLTLIRQAGPEANPALWSYQVAWALLYLGRDAEASALMEEYLRAHPADPGGVVRSGSKVGSRRSKTMIASTNDAFCPTLRVVTKSDLPDGVNSVLEIVINGIDAPAIARAMRAGIDAACRDGVLAISAGNYGGKLGPHHFYLRKIMAEGAPA